MWISVWDSQSAADMSFVHEWMASCFLSIRELIVRKIFINYINKKSTIWLIGDTEFLFSLSTWNLIHSLYSLMRFWVEHEKENSIALHTHVLFSIYLIYINIYINKYCKQNCCSWILYIHYFCAVEY